MRSLLRRPLRRLARTTLALTAGVLLTACYPSDPETVATRFVTALYASDAGGAKYCAGCDARYFKQSSPSERAWIGSRTGGTVTCRDIRDTRALICVESTFSMHENVTRAIFLERTKETGNKWRVTDNSDCLIRCPSLRD